MSHTTILTAIFVLIGAMATSQSGLAMPAQSQSVGMHHLTPKPATPVPAPADAQPEPEKETQSPAPIPKYTALTPKEALVSPEDLEEWNHLSDAASAYTKTNLDKLVYIIESDRGAVPPQGLFLAAKALADQKQMEQAALYFFVGQLRLTFDVTRWPPRANAEDIKRLKQDEKKSPDQASPNGNAAPRIDNPHAGITSIANNISHPILVWAMKDPARLNALMEKVKEWDASAPYAYDTGYPVNDPIPFDKWEKILPKVREDYFTRMNDLTKALSKIKS